MNIAVQSLASILSGNWWALLLRGLLAIAFGVFVWTQPGISLATLIMVFGAYALVEGVLGVLTAVVNRKDNDHWLVLLLWGLVSIGIGILTFMAPGITAFVLLFYIAVWAIVVGVLQIIAAVRLRKEIRGEWLLGLAGLGAVIFGVLLLARPGEGVLSVLMLISIYAVLSGILLVILAFKVRSIRGRISEKIADLRS
jgi:uncharacterized membrane protein HdeD (DUF308 family)